MATKIKSSQKLLFIGDSITDCGRRGAERPLGAGYVKLFNDLMTIREPAKNIQAVNKGIGGNTVKNLQDRWTDDAILQKPNYLFVKIGINDLHQQLRGTAACDLSPDGFEAIYDEILGRFTKKHPDCKIVLIDPFYISSEKSPNSFRHEVLKVINDYIAVVAKMAKKYHAKRLETHKMFQQLLKYNEPDVFCPEPVHPNQTGHLAIADALYELLS